MTNVKEKDQTSQSIDCLCRLVFIKGKGIWNCFYLTFLFIKNQLSMNFIDNLLYYPFINTEINPFGLIIPSYPYQSSIQSQYNKIESNNTFIKIEEVKSKKQKSHSKLIAKVKKLLKQLHREEAFNRKQRWTYEEDFLLKALVQEEKLEWKEIPKHFQKRTQNMCYSRYRRLELGLRQKRWKRQQEQQLIKLIQVYGQKWRKISSCLKNFTSKQIRQHYLNYLKPNIITSQFSIQEDMKICKHILEGSQQKHWKQLEDLLPCRSQVIIKRRYERKLKAIIESAYDEDD